MYRILFAAFFLCAFGRSHSQTTERDTSQTILDYYLHLPNEFFYCEIPDSFSEEKRLSLITLKDEKNGYIKSVSESFPMEVALFKTPQGADIVAVCIQCGAGCMCNRIAFFGIQPDGSWKDMTFDVFPTADQYPKEADVVMMQLPRYGTTITAVDAETEKPVFYLKWVNGEFVVSGKK